MRYFEGAGGSKQILGRFVKLRLKRIIFRALFQVPSKTNTSKFRPAGANVKRSAEVQRERLTASRLGKSNTGKLARLLSSRSTRSSTEKSTPSSSSELFKQRCAMRPVPK